MNSTRAARARAEVAALLCTPQRVIPLLSRIACDQWRSAIEPRHLYSYSKTIIPTADALPAVIAWILNAQHPDGGIAAYYSLLTGFSAPYPEVTGYIIPTLYDFAATANDPPSKDASSRDASRKAAEKATHWLLSLQVPSGAFPAGLHLRNADAQPSVFNTGQILQGLVRAHIETKNPAILNSAIAAADWLAAMQQPDGSWSGPAAYQGSAHTYYSMVAWSLAALAAESNSQTHTAAAARNLDWVLSHVQPDGWIDGINLRGHPTYLHFIAYAIQGMLECGILLHRDEAIQSATKSAWLLLRRFETNKRLAGAYQPAFHGDQTFACLTGNAQMACIWLRLFDVTSDLRYLNAALKMNELLKQSLPQTSIPGIAAGVAGSAPIWGPYQPMRFISWGAKFLADALLHEQQIIFHALH